MVDEAYEIRKQMVQEARKIREQLAEEQEASIAQVRADVEELRRGLALLADLVEIFGSMRRQLEAGVAMDLWRERTLFRQVGGLSSAVGKENCGFWLYSSLTCLEGKW